MHATCLTLAQLLESQVAQKDKANLQALQAVNHVTKLTADVNNLKQEVSVDFQKILENHITTCNQLVEQVHHSHNM